jgi:superfamily II DNA helicase RecQ
VFVTPESAVTKTFGIFINRKQAMHRLDQVVVDKCHTILASRSNFQPKMQKLKELMMTGIQIVFMTATLRPRDEPRFCQSMNIIGKGIQKFQAPTSQPNIRYQVRRYVRTHEKGPDSKKQDSCIPAICQVVEELKLKYPAPATIIVYSSFVDQVGALGLALNFNIYHREVDSQKGKEQRVRD